MKAAQDTRMALDRKTALVLAFAAALAACGSPPTSPPMAGVPPDIERGRMLYENSCNACHSTQPHWRSQRLVASWSDLVAQVGRWQGIAGLGWSSAEIRDVATFLNEQFYHLPCDACAGPAASATR
jgi:mono/diheme cytochrome c family protein